VCDEHGRLGHELVAIALGTYLGGWRIIQTLGKRVSEIQTPQGFAAETASAAVILTSANLGFALSTTQVATGSIFGAGAGRRLATVQWGVAGQMALAWLLTLPAAAAVGAVAVWAASTGTAGTIIVSVVSVVSVALAAAIYAASRRRPVTAERQRRPRAGACRGGGLNEEPTMINWGALGMVSLVSTAAGVVIVVLVASALVGLSAREAAATGDAAEASDAGAELIGRATGPLMTPAAGTAVAAVCLLAVAAIVVYGLTLIIFHH
jgi:hypothetical protein